MHCKWALKNKNHSKPSKPRFGSPTNEFEGQHTQSYISCSHPNSWIVDIFQAPVFPCWPTKTFDYVVFQNLSYRMLASAVWNQSRLLPNKSVVQNFCHCLVLHQGLLCMHACIHTYVRTYSTTCIYRHTYMRAYSTYNTFVALPILLTHNKILIPWWPSYQ